MTTWSNLWIGLRGEGTAEPLAPDQIQAIFDNDLVAAGEMGLSSQAFLQVLAYREAVSHLGCVFWAPLSVRSDGDSLSGKFWIWGSKRTRKQWRDRLGNLKATGHEVSVFNCSSREDSLQYLPLPRF